MNSLKILFLHSLADQYDAEKRVVRSLPKTARNATCKDLRKLMEVRFQEGAAHVAKLEGVFRAFGASVKARKCEATIGLLQEGSELAAFFHGSPAINAALISSAQKTDHYAIASYASLHDWAELLGNQIASNILIAMLNERKASNQSLIRLALSRSNNEAFAACDIEDMKDKATVKTPKLSNRRAGIRPRTFNRIHPVLM
jgi:ferritin-like metal-binding protein YciE